MCLSSHPNYTRHTRTTAKAGSSVRVSTFKICFCQGEKTYTWPPVSWLGMWLLRIVGILVFCTWCRSSTRRSCALYVGWSNWGVCEGQVKGRPQALGELWGASVQCSHVALAAAGDWPRDRILANGYIGVSQFFLGESERSRHQWPWWGCLTILPAFTGGQRAETRSRRVWSLATYDLGSSLSNWYSLSMGHAWGAGPTLSHFTPHTHTRMGHLHGQHLLRGYCGSSVFLNYKPP